MAVFFYRAVDARGVKHKGVLDADNARHLRQQLRGHGMMVLSFQEGARGAYLPSLRKPRSLFPAKALTAFTRELSILLEGGLPLEKALMLIATQTPDLKRRERLLAVHEQVVAGASFAGSLGQYADDFPALYRAAILAGEQTGDLAAVLSKLAEYGEMHLRTMSKVKLAMLYPAILCAFSLTVVTGIMVFIFPDITRVFIQSGHPLPWLTSLLIGVSDFLRHYGWLLLLAMAGGAVAASRALADPALRLNLSRKLLHIPLVGPFVTAANLARFTGTLSMLRNSGVPLAEGLKITSQVLGNPWLKQAVEQTTIRVIEGSSLNQALAQAECFPASFVGMIASGEASGELDRVLELAARNQLKELENRMMFGVAILEPAIILFLGLMVLLIVLAIMMPILSMNQLVK